MNPLIFMSYRRDDSLTEARMVLAELRQSFGAKAVWMDERALQGGNDWPREVQDALRASIVVLVLIRKKLDWVAVDDEGITRRIDDEKDWVHQEVALALREKTVIPVLLGDGAGMPTKEGLPSDLKALADTQAMFLRKASWLNDLKSLIQRLRSVVGQDLDRGEAGEPEPHHYSENFYLNDLAEKTGYIDIRGLQVGTGQANRFPIDELFISLTTTRTPEPKDHQRPLTRGQRTNEDELESYVASHAPVPLHEALQRDRLVVVGDPGAGKTTFATRLVHALCDTLLGDQPDAAQQRLGIKDRMFPIFIRISDLASYVLQQGAVRLVASVV